MRRIYTGAFACLTCALLGCKGVDQQQSSSHSSSASSAAVPLVSGELYSTIHDGEHGVHYEPVYIDSAQSGFDKAGSLEAFSATLYPHLRQSGCGACHNSANPEAYGGAQAPLHSDDNIELAHEYALTRVDFRNTKRSPLYSRMSIDRHNCAQETCAESAQAMLAAIDAWKKQIGFEGDNGSRSIPASEKVDIGDVQQWINTDRANLDEAERPYIVYTSLHELHNEGLSADELNIIRVALSKALNSTARFAPSIVNPTDVTGQGILYKFDVRDYWGFNQGVETIKYGGSDQLLTLTNMRDYRGQSVGYYDIYNENYPFNDVTTEDPAHALRIWERVLHGNVETTSPPNIDGFKGEKLVNDAGEYNDIDALQWVEAAQLVYTLTRPDVYNAIMMNPGFGDHLERNLQVDKSKGADSYDYSIVFDAITIDSRLLWRADRPNGQWYWKTTDVFTGNLASGVDRNIDEVYSDPRGADIRFPWWANPIPKFILPRFESNEADTVTFSSVVSFGLSSDHPDCDPIAGFCRHFTGEGGGQQSASEIIYSLENGLQGYYLSGAFNQRRTDAFTEIVRDPRMYPFADDDIVTMTGEDYARNLEKDGNFYAARLNVGSSCIGCHADGMKRFNNDLRLWLDYAPERLPGGPYGAGAWLADETIRSRVRELYKSNDHMKRLVEKDRLGFIEAMAEIRDAMIWGDDKNIYVEPVIWTVEHVQNVKYRYPQTEYN